MTAYSITRPEDLDREHGVVVDVPSRYDLLIENERLKTYLEAAREDVSTYRQMWAAAHDARIKAEGRSSKAFRVLASLGRLSPRMAGLVSAARKEVWRA